MSVSSTPLVSHGTKLLSSYHRREKLVKRSRLCGKSRSPFLGQPLNNAILFWGSKDVLSVAPLNSTNWRPGEEDKRALDTVLKLYTAIKSQNIRALSDIISDECRCVCNFFSCRQTFQGKEQVLEFFKYLIRSLGNNIEFVVKPTFDNGLNVGVSWRLEWNKAHFPLGTGFGFYICQIYQGKVFIRNVEMFMEPLFHIEPYRLKVMARIMYVIDKMSSHASSKDKLTKPCFDLLVAAAVLILTKPMFY